VRKYVNIGGCGCCAEDFQYEQVGTAGMPDGRDIIQARTEDGRTLWIDPELKATWEVD
jgi:hypothetical protein